MKRTRSDDTPSVIFWKADFAAEWNRGGKAEESGLKGTLLVFLERANDGIQQIFSFSYDLPRHLQAALVSCGIRQRMLCTKSQGRLDKCA